MTAARKGPRAVAGAAGAEAGDPAGAAIHLSGVALRAGARTLVAGLDLELAAGERLVVVGGNGSGKSTLLRALAGLGEAAAGTIRRPPSPPGMLFQDGALWPHLDVDAHLAFVAPRGDRAWHERLLALLGLLPLRARRPESLSGGERVRLALARAFAPRPAWVLLDEPLTHLDAQLIALLRRTLPRLLDELGATAVTVCHGVDEIPLFGDRVLCLSGEGPWWLGGAQEALESPPTPLLAALSGGGTLLWGEADAQGRAGFGLGLASGGHRPGERVAAFLRAADVTLGSPDAAPPAAGAGARAGRWLGPDGRGGAWVLVEDILLRCDGDGRPRSPGEAVGVTLRGTPRTIAAGGPR